MSAVARRAQSEAKPTAELPKLPGFVLSVTGECMFHILRRTVLKLACIAPIALATASPPAVAKTLTVVMHSDLRIIDPGFTTAYITRDHGYMVYDTLLATDANFKVQPQMADWKVSDDK